MAVEGDDDLQLIRASAGLISDLQSALPKLLWKRHDSSRVHQLVRSCDLDHVVQLIEPFQAEPQLLDAHLKTFLPSIVEAYLAFLQIPQTRSPTSTTMPLDIAASKLLYLFCKVRGEKIVIGFLNNEPKYLELVLKHLEDHKATSAHSDVAWEKSYALLLWLTHLMLVPFDLSSISTTVPTSKEVQNLTLPAYIPPLARRVVWLGVKYLASATREQDAAAKMFVRLVTRPDMQRLSLPSPIVSWALAQLLAPPSSSSTTSLHTFLGPLRFLVGMTVSVDSNEIASLIPSIYSAGQRLMDDAMLAFIGSSAVAKKLVVKLLRNIALLSLQSPFDSLVDFFESTSVLEETIQYCLQSLEDRDTPVRFAASKALSMIILRLDTEMGLEVVQAVLESFKEDIPLSSSTPDFGAANPLRWHGLALTLAHILFRRSASPQQLPDILNALLLAINFEQRSTAGVSTGSNVRDAACFGIWSLSRRYTTQELLSVEASLVGFDLVQDLRSVIQVVAIQLLLSACLDPSGNIRRGSSAALQELIGRHPDQVSKGIALVQVVDYHAVGLRQRAMVSVAQQASDLDELYRKSLLLALQKWRGLGSPDVPSREAAARSMGLLSAPQPAELVQATLGHLCTDIAKFPKRDVEQCQGSLLALSEIIDSKVSSKREHQLSDSASADHSYLLLLWGVFSAGNSVFRTQTLRASRAELPAAILRLVASLAELSLTSLKGQTNADIDEAVLTSIITGILTSSEPSVLHGLPRMVKALSQLAATGRTQAPILKLSDCVGKVVHDSSGIVLQGAARIVALGAAFPWLEDIYSCDPMVVCKMIAGIVVTAPLTEWRTTGLQALNLILDTESVRDEVIQTIVSAVDAGLNDYTITERGDVGSLVRTRSIQCVQHMWSRDLLDRDSDLGRILQANIIRLCLEKMDRVRLQAARCLKEDYDYVKTAADLDVGSYQYFVGLFGPLCDSSPAWKVDAIIKGSVSCAGTGAEGLLWASRSALVDMLCRSSVDTRISCLYTLTSLLKDHTIKGIETQPLLELIAYLLNTLPSVVPADNSFNWRLLLSQVQKSHFKSNNIPRILSAIDVYQSLAEKHSVRSDTLKKLVSMLKTNPYPKVRVTVAECLFVVTGHQALKDIDWSKPNHGHECLVVVR